MVCLNLKLDLSCLFPWCASWDVLRQRGLGRGTQPLETCSWVKKERVFFPPPTPPALSWAPQDRMSSEMEFTIKLSTLFSHIIPTVIL